jgi:3-oxoacyl-[acyl-carrier protein] reductase
MTLAGKAALVSGAGGGIGRAIALAFAEAGAAVACCDIDAPGIEETARLVEAAGGGAIARRCDGSRSALGVRRAAALLFLERLPRR